MRFLGSLYLQATSGILLAVSLAGLVALIAGDNLKLDDPLTWLSGTGVFVALVYIAPALLFLRNGREVWRTDEIAVEVVFRDALACTAWVYRDQKLMANAPKNTAYKFAILTDRPEAQISKPEPGDDERQWRLVPKGSWVETQRLAPRLETFRFGNGWDAFFLPGEKEGGLREFPFDWVDVIRPWSSRWARGRLHLQGAVLCENCFCKDDEFYEISFTNAMPARRAVIRVFFPDGSPRRLLDGWLISGPHAKRKKPVPVIGSNRRDGYSGWEVEAEKLTTQALRLTWQLESADGPPQRQASAAALATSDAAISQ